MNNPDSMLSWVRKVQDIWLCISSAASWKSIHYGGERKMWMCDKQHRIQLEEFNRLKRMNKLVFYMQQEYNKRNSDR